MHKLTYLIALSFGGFCTCQVPGSQIAAHPPKPVLAPGQSAGRVVQYQSNGRELKGILYMPEGRGPFGVVVWNHEANKDPKDEPELGLFYARHGYAFFEPLRSGHGGNPGKTVDELLAPAVAANFRDPKANRRFVDLMETANQDVNAAVRWIKAQPGIDASHIFMSGISYGGLACLLDADTEPGIRAYIVFSGGARLFGNKALRARLIRAVRNAKAPIFLIQAENDYTTDPVRILGPLLRSRGDGSQSRLYPAFGPQGDIAMGHVAFATWNLGTQVWGDDVLKFMAAVSRR